MYKHQETKDALNDWEKIKSMSKSVKENFKYSLVDILENPRNSFIFASFLSKKT